MEDHLAAGRAFVPEIVRHVRLLDQRADLRPDEIGEPAHLVILRSTAPLGALARDAGGEALHEVERRLGSARAGLAVGIEVGGDLADQGGADHGGVGDLGDGARPAPAS